MAAALALAMPAYATDSEAKQEMTQAKQEAQEQKAEAHKEMSEAKAEARKDMSEAEREAHEKTAKAEREAREKTAEAKKDAREESADARKEMREEGREVRASDDRAAAAGAAAAGDADKAPLSSTAKETLKKLHASSQMEVGMARIAKDKAENDKVKDLADKIEDDHQEFAEKASEIARERNVELSAHDSMDKNRKHVEQMQGMQGAAFDRHFAKMMADEHKKDIAELKKAQTKLRANKADEEVAELVDDALPKLEEHQRLAMEAQSELGAEQRQGRRGSATGSTATTPSSTDATDTRSGATENSATQGNNTRPDELMEGDKKDAPGGGEK